MPLHNFDRRFVVTESSLENSPLLVTARKHMGLPLYNMAKRVFTKYIQDRDPAKSGGYFEFGFIMGHQGQAPKKDVDHLWHRMLELYTDDDLVRRILGTICMSCVACDTRQWYYREDMDKKQKLAHGQVPEANQYFIGSEK